MACPLFDDGRFARCTAVAGLHVPTCHERERYCRSDESDDCPTFRLHQLRGSALPEEVYFALWTTPVPQPGLDADDTQPIPLSL
jgi:hypothetical protein